MMTIPEFAAFLKNHDHFVILTHRRPDGDTIGSAAALCRALRSMKKDAWVLDNGQFTPRFAPFLEGLVCADVQEGAVVLAVDIATDDLLSFRAEALHLSPDAAIDHHARNDLTCPRKLVMADCAACGEIVSLLLEAMQLPLTPEIASCLYVAISTDTGCFRYRNTSAATLRHTAKLLEAGADAAEINRIFFDTKSLSRLRLESYLTDSMEFFAGGTVCLCTIPDAVLQKLGATEDDIASISGFARSVEGVHIGITVREEDGGKKGKLSLRTDKHYDANALCSQLGGGGHAAAAGASVPGGMEAARAAILKVLTDNGIAL